MDFLKFKRADLYTFTKDIQENTKRHAGLTDYQREKIEEYLDSSTYTIVIRDEREKHSPWYRLTIPFYFIYWCLLVIAMPFKWLTTGKGYYNIESKPMKIIQKWQNLLSI
jgi:hypothetical protein